LPFEQFHRDECLPFGFVNIVDSANVRVIQRGGSLCFALETLQGSPVPGYLFRKKLQSNSAFQLQVFGFIGDTHAPPPIFSMIQKCEMV
jgi:hypothetical protein